VEIVEGFMKGDASESGDGRSAPGAEIERSRLTPSGLDLARQLLDGVRARPPLQKHAGGKHHKLASTASGV